jgi:hypothetical protein
MLSRDCVTAAWIRIRDLLDTYRKYYKQLLQPQWVTLFKCHCNYSIRVFTCRYFVAVCNGGGSPSLPVSHFSQLLLSTDSTVNVPMLPGSRLLAAISQQPQNLLITVSRLSRNSSCTSLQSPSTDCTEIPSSIIASFFTWISNSAEVYCAPFRKQVLL